MLKTTTLPSGTVLGLEYATWAVAGQLRQTVARELLKVNKQLSGSLLEAVLAKNPDGSIDTGKVLQALGTQDVDSFANVCLILLASPELEAVLFACMVKCTLTPPGEAVQKITLETFEPAERRKDFYPAAVEVIRQNLALFFDSLNFGLKPGSPQPAKPSQG